MKNLIKLTALALIATVLMNANKVCAQASNDETQMIQGMWGIQKRDIVTQYMKLSAEDAAKFWPIYDQYDTDRKKLGVDRLQLLNDYAAKFGKMTDADADKIITGIFTSDEAYTALMKKYYGKFKAAMGATTAVSFMQLEYYLMTAVRFTIQDNIPFIGDLEKTKKPQQ